MLFRSAIGAYELELTPAVLKTYVVIYETLSFVSFQYSSAKTELDKKEIILLELQEKVRELEEIQEKVEIFKIFHT